MNLKVEHPEHYNAVPNWEVIDTIRKDLSPDEYIGFLKGNILKYRLRAGKKGDALEDIDKANYYEKLLIAFLKTKEVNKSLDTLLKTDKGGPFGPAWHTMPWSDKILD